MKAHLAMAAMLLRSPTIDEATKKRLVDTAQALGFDTTKLIYVDQRPL